MGIYKRRKECFLSEMDDLHAVIFLRQLVSHIGDPVFFCHQIFADRIVFIDCKNISFKDHLLIPPGTSSVLMATEQYCHV